MANISKRKRESMDQAGPTIPQGPTDYGLSSPNPTSQFEDQYIQIPPETEINLAEALSQHNAGDQSRHDDGNNGQSVTDTASAALQHYTMTVPTTTEANFLAQAADVVEGESDTAFTFQDAVNTEQDTIPHTFSMDSLKDGSQPAQPASEGSPNRGDKPAVGSDQWHKVRRDNHKEVERRRRETINEGINELAKIVPGCEKNKGSILARAVQFITQLKENESQNIEKWTLEKLLTEQAIAELSSTCDKLKAELKNAYIDNEAWRRAGERAGIAPTDEDRAAVEKMSGEDD